MEGPITHFAVNEEFISYTKANGAAASIQLPFVELPAGTLLFRGVQLPNPKKDEDPRLFVRDWLGYPKGDRFCLTPTHNTFFYTTPFVPFGAHTVGEWYNAVLVCQLVKDVRVVCMIGPSKWVRGGKEIKAMDGTAPIQRCDKFDYSCIDDKTSRQAKIEKEQKSWDNCIRPEFAKEKNFSGWMAIADFDSLDNFKEGLSGKDTTMGKYIMELESRLPGKGIDLLTSTYTDASRHRGFPELVLYPWSPHPGTENQYTEARTEEDAADAIAEMSDKFNYLPIACITERGILEAFTGDFKSGDLPAYATTAAPGSVTRKVIDKYQADYLEKLQTKGVDIEGFGNAKLLFDTRTGFYVMDKFTKDRRERLSALLTPYTTLCMGLSTQEERERVLEYKIRYRRFDIMKIGAADRYIDGSVIKERNFIFERPDELYPQFKQLDIRLPSRFIPYIWGATKIFEENTANRKMSQRNFRGVEEAKRKAAIAEEKIKESLEIIAKKKAERDAKRGIKPTTPIMAPNGARTPPLAPQDEQQIPLLTYNPVYLTGIQQQIPIIQSLEEALTIGREALSQPEVLLANPKLYSEGMNINLFSPWDMSDRALTRTLKYIFEFLHYPCYMLCVSYHEPYLFKLDPGGMNETNKEILQKEIQEKGITDLNVDTSRVMQCIIKPYTADTSTAKEWLTFLQDPLHKKYLLPNGVYILNLSDSMLLRIDLNSPFGYFTRGLVTLPKEYKGYYIPILSYSGHTNYDDVPIPNFDDLFESDLKLSTAAKTYFYEKTINKAVFRGGSTGCGTTTDSNMRLKITDPAFLNSLRNKDMLDVGITTITKQYKMDEDIGLSRVDPSKVQVVAPLTMDQQSQYKYIIHIDGNVTAYRLLKMMGLGSCILRVESSYKNWLDAKSNYAIRGYNIDWLGNNDYSDEKDPLQCHFIWIKRDLSNLDDVLDFCNEHEDVCHKIADNGRELSQRVLQKDFLFASFVNLLASCAMIAVSPPQGGGGKPKKAPKGTRKQTRKTKTKTRKQTRKEPQEDPLVLAEYRGGGIDPSMEEYVQNTMRDLWRTFLRKTN